MDPRIPNKGHHQCNQDLSTPDFTTSAHLASGCNGIVEFFTGGATVRLGNRDCKVDLSAGPQTGMPYLSGTPTGACTARIK